MINIKTYTCTLVHEHGNTRMYNLYTHANKNIHNIHPYTYTLTLIHTYMNIPIYIVSYIVLLDIRWTKLVPNLLIVCLVKDRERS